MDWFLNLVNDPFSAIAVLAVAALLTWWTKRHDRGNTPKVRYLRTAEECIAYGIDPIFAGYAKVVEPVSPLKAPTVKPTPAAIVPMAKSDVGLLAPPMLIKLSDIADDPAPINIMIIGNKGAGKTTLLRTLVHRRSDILDEIIAVDPHSSPGKWEGRVVGGGLAWDAIGAELTTMNTAMQQRFVDLAAGVRKEMCFPQRLVIGDEFPAIAAELDGKQGRVNAAKILAGRITQGRKVCEIIFIAAQSDDVESLGLQGQGALRTCFDVIVFLGATVGVRAKYHGCPPATMTAAQLMARPAVVWYPDRNVWGLLRFDLAPVKEGDVLSVVTYPPHTATTDTGISVPARGPILGDMGDMLPNIARDTDTPALNISDDMSLGLDDDTIKTLHKAGYSANAIAKKLRGSQQKRLARIAAALNEDVDEEYPQRAMTA